MNFQDKYWKPPMKVFSSSENTFIKREFLFQDDLNAPKEKNSENTSIDRTSCATVEKALLDNELNMADFKDNHL